MSRKKSIGKTLFYFLVIAVILWPKYIVFKIEPLPGIRIDRLFLGLAFLIYMIYFLFTKRPLLKLKHFKKIAFLLLFLSFAFFISFINYNPNIKSLYSYINFLLTGPFFAVYCFTFLDSKREIENTLKFFVLILIITNIVGVFEFFIGHPLFDKFLITKTKDTIMAASAVFRGQKYRVQSVFTNPLVYAQFLIALLPINWYFFKKTKNNFILKLILLLNLFLSIIMIFLTDSRAGMGLLFLTPFIIFYLKSTKKIKLFLNLIILIILSLIVYKLIIFANEIPFDIVKKLALEGANQKTLSSYKRVVQLKVTIMYFFKEPLFGFGYGNIKDLIQPFIDILDSYFLTLILSGGVIGLFAFVSVVFYGLNISYNYNEVDKSVRNLLLYVKVSVINLLLFYLVLSIDHNNFLLFTLIAILTIIKVNYSRGVK